MSFDFQTVRTIFLVGYLSVEDAERCLSLFLSSGDSSVMFLKSQDVQN